MIERKIWSRVIPKSEIKMWFLKVGLQLKRRLGLSYKDYTRKDWFL